MEAIIKEGNDDDGNIRQEVIGQADSENIDDENQIPDTDSESEGEGSNPVDGASEKGEGGGEVGGASSPTGEQENTDEEERKRLKRERDKENARARRAAAKEGLIPADVVPRVPRTRKSSTKDVKATSVTAEFLAQQIMGTHELLSIFLGEEAKIDEKSSVMLGNAAYEVIKEYDLAFIGKYGKWFGLVTAVAIVEVPVVVKLRKKSADQSLTPLTQSTKFLPQETSAAASLLGVAEGRPQ